MMLSPVVVGWGLGPVSATGPPLNAPRRPQTESTTTPSRRSGGIRHISLQGHPNGTAPKDPDKRVTVCAAFRPLYLLTPAHADVLGDKGSRNRPRLVRMRVERPRSPEL